MIVDKVRLVERNVSAARTVERAHLAHSSGCCSATILGSAAKWCSACGRSIAAADIDHDYHPPGATR